MNAETTRAPGHLTSREVGDGLMAVQDLRVHFGPEGAPIRAVDGVSFGIHQRETLALVGESGCGKSVTALALARLVPAPPGRYVSGTVWMAGRNGLSVVKPGLEALRGADIAYIFQDPATALNPVLTIGRQVAEAVRLHGREVDALAETIALLDRVGIPRAKDRMRAYPHELSGGMQQRVMIAMALSCRPRLLVADEPTTALDVTIQAQILDLLVELQGDLGMAMLLITHNLALVADVAHRIHVMYCGRIVEAGPTRSVLRQPAHPYTYALLHAVPHLQGGRGRLRGIDGTVPPPGEWPPGCAFHPRCVRCEERCRTEVPAATFFGEDRWACCFYPHGQAASIGEASR
jgi:oligopeptide/dipeptide ABC transporter ATP-binding protein